MSNVSDPLISIRDMAQRSGVASSTPRYYEKLGLIASERQLHLRAHEGACAQSLSKVQPHEPDVLCGMRLHEPIGEAISFALDRGIEHLDRVRIVSLREHGAFRVQQESSRLHLFASECRLNPMQ
jgi:hypothetical protein